MTKFWKGKKVLVTGGAGFIGSHTVDALVAHGAKVVILDNLSTGLRENINSAAKFYKADVNSVRDTEKIFKKERPDFLMHFAAAVVGAPRSIKHPFLDATSVTGTANILEQAKHFGVKKILYSSSVFAYGNAKKFPTPETEPLKPLNPYSISKAACESYVSFFRSHFGLPAVVLRYGTVYGPRHRWGAVPSYIQEIMAGIPVQIYGRKTRDYIYISDVVQANLDAFEKNIYVNTPVFNVASGKEFNLHYVHKTISRLLGKTQKPRSLPAFAGEINRSYIDIRKAKRELGWRPRVSFEDGLKKTVDWFLGHRDKTKKIKI